MSLYSELLAAGLKLDSYRSDLYVRDCFDARQILERFPIEKSNARRFVSNLDGLLWIEVPFAYVPWWELRGMK
jgi:hypothetical protein